MANLMEYRQAPLAVDPNPLDQPAQALGQAATEVGKLTLEKAGLPAAITEKPAALALATHVAETAGNQASRIIPIHREETSARAHVPERPTYMNNLSVAGEAVNATFGQQPNVVASEAMKMAQDAQVTATQLAADRAKVPTSRFDQESNEQQALFDSNPKLRNLTDYVRSLRGGRYQTTIAKDETTSQVTMNVIRTSDQHVLNTDEFLGELSDQQRTNIQLLSRGELSAERVAKVIEQEKVSMPEIVNQPVGETLSEIGRGALKDLQSLGAKIRRSFWDQAKMLVSKSVQATPSPAAATAIRDGRARAADSDRAATQLIDTAAQDIPTVERDANAKIKALKLPEAVSDTRDVEPILVEQRGFMKKLAKWIAWLGSPETMGAPK